MSTNLERKVLGLFDEYTAGFIRGNAPSMESVLARCPASERTRLADALAGFEFVYDNLVRCTVSPRITEAAIERLQRIRKQRQAFLDAEARANALAWDRVVTDPLLQLAAVLYPGATSVRAKSLSSIGIMNRATPMRVAEPNSTGTALPVHKLNPFERRAARLFARTQAEQLLDKVGLDDAPVDLEAIAHQLFLFVREVDMDSTEGCLVTDGETGGILLNSRMHDERRRRFTLAHEIGHFIMHRRNGRHFRDSEHEIQSPDSRPEVEASAFASFLLLPPRLLPRDFGRVEPAFAIADAVSEQFNVSLLAVLRRLVQDSNYRTMLIMSDGIQVKWPELSPEIEGYHVVKNVVPPGSAAAQLIAENAVDTYSRTVNADVWLNSGTLRAQDAVVIEESRRFPSGHIYTILNVVES